MKSKLPVTEIFASIQGEGVFAGAKTYFVRFWGCDCHCHWCFTGGHKVTMSDYTKKDISQVNRGDIIWGYNEKTNRLELTTVTNVATRVAPTIESHFESKVFRTTEDHPFLVTNKYHRRSWANTKQLQEAAGVQKDRFIFEVPFIATPEITEDFKAGYLVGYFDGDGNFYENATMVSAKIVSIAEESLIRLKEFGKHFGIDFRDILHKGGMHNITIQGIQTNKKEEYLKLLSLADLPKTAEFYRGYLAAIFDAEGSYDGATIKISQKASANPDVCVAISDALQAHDFEYNQRPEGFALRGGFKEAVRFFQYCDPVIFRKKASMYSTTVKAEITTNLKKFIGAESTGVEETVYNITTENHTYLIDDVIVHNCDEPQHRDAKPTLVADSVETIMEQLDINVANIVTLTGGNPCIRDLSELVKVLKEAGFKVHVETQGTKLPSWLRDVDFVTISPKGPSSGNPADLFQLQKGLKSFKAVSKQFKPVVMVDNKGNVNAEDMELLKKIVAMFPKNYVVAQLGDDGKEGVSYADRYHALCEEIHKHSKLNNVRILPQLHKIGNMR